MENYQMGRSCGRPYRTTCGMNQMPSSRQMPMHEHTPDMDRMSAGNQNHRSCERKQECACHLPGMTTAQPGFYAGADKLPPAMAYVPCQKFSGTFDLCYSLQAGTIFPELCKPFCGKRGMCR